MIRHGIAWGYLDLGKVLRGKLPLLAILGGCAAAEPPPVTDILHPVSWTNPGDGLGYRVVDDFHRVVLFIEADPRDLRPRNEAAYRAAAESYLAEIGGAQCRVLAFRPVAGERPAYAADYRCGE